MWVRCGRALVLSLAAWMGSHSLMAEDAAVAKITFDDHIKPIFREHCLSCHNSNDKKGGLALDTYSATLEGGSGGEIVVEADLESSRLWELTAHVSQPFMPPNQDKIADAKLDILKKWIEQGMPENSGSVSKKPKASSAMLTSFSLGKPEGPLPMPVSLFRQPVIFTNRSAAISAMTASPWSPLVAISGQKQVVLYNTDTGELAGILPFPEGEPQSITFSRDGRLVLVGGGKHSHSGYAILFNIVTGERIAKVGDELDIVLCADLSEDNSKIAIGGPQKIVRVYATATGEKLYEMKKHTDWIYDVKFSPDGVLLASSDRSNGLIVWEADTGRLYQDLVGHRGEIRQIAWRPDSNLLASSSLDGTVRFWEMFGGKQTKSINAHGGGVTSIAFATNGTMVTGGRDNLVKVWNQNGDPIKSMPAMSEAVMEVAITADPAKVIGGDWNGNVMMWDVQDPTKAMPMAANPPTLDMVFQQRESVFQTVSAEVNSASALMIAADQGLEQAKNEYNAAAENLKKLTDQLTTVTQQRDATKTAAAAQDQKINEVAAMLAALQKERAATGETLKTLETQVATVTTEQQTATAKANEAKAKLDQLQKQADEAKAKHAEVAARLSAAQKQLEVAQADRAAFFQASAKLKEEADQLIAQSTALDGQLKSATDGMGAKQNEMTEMVTQIQQMQQQLKALQEQMAAREAVKAQADAELAKMAEQTKTLQAQTDELKAKSEEATAKLKLFQESYGAPGAGQ